MSSLLFFRLRITLLCCLPAFGVISAQVDTSDQPVKKLKPGQMTQQQKIDQIAKYLVETYTNELKSKDWVVRALATVSLAQIDHPYATNKLVDMLKTEPKGISRVYVWEALNARAGLLDADQRQKWLIAGHALAKSRDLRRHLRAGLMSLAAASGASDDNLKLFNKLFMETDIANPEDHTTLKAMRKAVAAWKEPKLTRRLIAMLTGDPRRAYKCEYLLSGLNMKIPATPNARDNKRLWGKTKIAWTKWLNKIELKKVLKGDEGYAGGSDLIPPPEKIDPKSPKWREKLELPRLKLDHLDVSLVVDCTGSMSSVINWLRRDLKKMLEALRMISREPRMGLVFYRDKTDQFVTRSIPLTGREGLLQTAVDRISAQGGGDFPEAVFEALAESIKNQRWSRKKDAKKVIVLIGDAPPHEENLGKIEKMVTAAAKEGFRFYCVKATTYTEKILTESDEIDRTTDKKTFEDFQNIALHGKGKSFWGQYLLKSTYITDERDFKFSKWRKNPNCKIISELVKGVLAVEYHVQAEPFVNILMEYVGKP